MAGVLTGKIALITGAGSGIGRASALAFAREGATVVVSDIIADGGEETVRLVQAMREDRPAFFKSMSPKPLRLRGSSPRSSKRTDALTAPTTTRASKGKTC